MKRTLVASFVLACLTQAPAWAQTPIKIGFVAELSGPQGIIGQDQWDGFMLFVERNGGKLGGVPVQILKEDSQVKPEVGVQIAQKFVEKERVPIVVTGSYSNVLMAMHRPIVEKNVFLVSALSGPSVLAGAQCSPYTYVTSFQLDTPAEAMGKYASEKGYKRVYLMSFNYQAGKDMMAGFKRLYKGTIVDEVYTPLNQPDFSAELTQLAAAKPDAVFVFYAGSVGINFVRQYQQAGLMKTIPLLSQGAVDGVTLPALKEAAIGAYTVSPWGTDLKNAANRRFVDEYEKKYKRIPTQFAAQSYDAAQLIDSALKKVKGNVDNKPALMAALKAADFPSVRGKFKFANNNFPVQDLHIQEVAKDDKGRVTLKSIATPLKDYVDGYSAQCPLK